ncbi:hypothetical protein CYMTET_9332 [Cymbomonas tetramitiformis]|uniref:Uncharacterized protein n=1 Tax=Cymbomonas tetramitiformis TaxID=36881 RepID=A0AAE0GRI7_9CHLO|nr:hypothetical protein CYMTET_9332 [Cymbomonas tetramitiformis]
MRKAEQAGEEEEEWVRVEEVKGKRVQGAGGGFWMTRAGKGAPERESGREERERAEAGGSERKGREKEVRSGAEAKRERGKGKRRKGRKEARKRETVDPTTTLPLVRLFTSTSSQPTPAELAICSRKLIWKEALKFESSKAEMLKSEKVMLEGSASNYQTWRRERGQRKQGEGLGGGATKGREEE